MSRPHIAELSVKDLALVSDLRLELGPGLTVLTGETGAEIKIPAKRVLKFRIAKQAKDATMAKPKGK